MCLKCLFLSLFNRKIRSTHSSMIDFLCRKAELLYSNRQISPYPAEEDDDYGAKGTIIMFFCKIFKHNVCVDIHSLQLDLA